MCAGGSAVSGADGSSSGIAGVFSGVLRGLGTLHGQFSARATPQTRFFAAPVRLHAAFPGPAAATTAIPALTTLRRSFPPF